MSAVRRVLSLLMLSLLLGMGVVTAAGTASAAPVAKPQCSSTVVNDCVPKTANSTVPGQQTQGEKTTKYCVSNYKPNSTVTVTNQKTGKTVVINTNSQGHGCVDVPVTTGCQTIQASGVNGTGQATTTTASVCVMGKTVHHGSGVLPFTGSNIIIPGALIGLGLIGLGSMFLLFLRRRRLPAAA